jgi:hypothetical protein
VIVVDIDAKRETPFMDFIDPLRAEPSQAESCARRGRA